MSLGIGMRNDPIFNTIKAQNLIITNMISVINVTITGTATVSTALIDILGSVSGTGISVIDDIKVAAGKSIKTNTISPNTTTNVAFTSDISLNAGKGIQTDFIFGKTLDNVEFRNPNTLTNSTAFIQTIRPGSGSSEVGIMGGDLHAYQTTHLDFDVTVGTRVITPFATLSNLPVSGTDGANKNYVDAVLSSGFSWKNTAKAATTANLTAVYAHGAAGVGATLTNSGALAAFSVDGYSASATDRILVKNQTNVYENGVYVVTTVGSGAVAWVLTRAIDYDTVAEATVGAIVPVNSGTVNGNSAWMQVTSPAAIGPPSPADDITFSQFLYPPSTFMVKTDQAITNHALLIGGATTNIRSLAVLTNGQLAIGSTGADPVVASLTGTANQVIVTPGAGSITLSTPQSIGTASNVTFNSLTLTTPLSAANGGTGIATYTIGDLIIATGATTLAPLLDVATGNVLLSGGVGVIPSYGKVGLTTHVSGILPVANGGTGTGLTYTNGQLLIGNTATGSLVVAALTTDATKPITITNGAGSIQLATTQDLRSTANVTFNSATLTSALTSANGGTGISSYTIGDIIYCSATPNTLAKLAGNSTSTVMYLQSTGTGAAAQAPAWAQISAAQLSNGTTGSGAVVLATSPVLVTPALGTPSSGVLTNCTSLPAASVNSATVSTYVPTLTDGTTTFTMSVQTGEYWTIAGKTTFSGHVDWSSKNGATAAIQFSVPVVSTTTVDSTSIIIGYASGMPSGAILLANVDPNNHKVVFHKIVAGTTSNLTAADLGNSGSLVIGGTYY